MIRRAEEKDAPEIARIFNHYIREGTSAFLDEPVASAVFFGWLMEMSCDKCVYVAEKDGKVLGFGVLKQYFDRRVFRRAAEPGYFIGPGETGRGIGSKLYETLEKDALRLGIKRLLVSISSENKGSIRFHSKRGFAKCGEFKKVGFKLGREFDVVWMQKEL